MITTVSLLCWLAIGAPPAAEPAPPTESEAPEAADPDAPAAEVPPAEPTTPAKGGRRRSLRTESELFDCRSEGDPGCGGQAPALDAPGERGPRRKVFGAGAVRPDLLAPRFVTGASLLGFLVGFGTGFWYGGDHLQGVIFSAADAALWIALAGTVAAFNQLVIHNDFRTLRSLARGERRFGEREANLYAVTWVLGGLLVASHAYQGIAAIFTAMKTNDTLDGFAIVPLQGGAQGTLGLRF